MKLSMVKDRLIRLGICLVILLILLRMQAVAVWILVAAIDRYFLAKNQKISIAKIKNWCTSVLQRLILVINQHGDSAQPENCTEDQVSFIPSDLVEKPLSQEEADQKAQEWWDSQAIDGSSGEEKIYEILAEIANSNPSIHSCNLSDYKALKLPTSVSVLNSLLEILRKEGLAADLTPDNELLVSWGQDQTGVEIGQA